MFSLIFRIVVLQRYDEESSMGKIQMCKEH